MSKRKSDIESDINDIYGDTDERNRRFKEKNSLDSDEEEEKDEEYDILPEDDIEGQEDSTIESYEGIKITPFNMKEELEEGHFDKDGMYIFDKNKEIKDSWIENIDWVKIKEKEKDMKEIPDDDSESEEEEFDEKGIYTEIISFVKPGETIAKALRRLGGNKGKIQSASQRWKAKKQKVQEADKQSQQDKDNFMKLTELADKVLSSGNMEVYELTYEKINFLLKKFEPVKTHVPEGIDSDDALDMFADNFDKGKDEKDVSKSTEKVGSNKAKEEANPNSSTNGDPVVDSGGNFISDEVMWEYKWKNEEEQEIHGPFTSSQMLQWTEENYFPDGVFVRKVSNKDGSFYSSRRIDFELYT